MAPPKNNARLQKQILKAHPVPAVLKPTPRAAPAPPKRQPSLIDAARERVTSAQFRLLNEKLYTSTSSSAQHLLRSDAELFDAYHAGFRAQVSKWTLNPVDAILKRLEKLPGVIGDFGCGDAKIAQTLTSRTVHSFDLVARQPCVTACNIAHVPLADDALDVAVFSLSLMGTDWPQFLAEAHRTVKPGGRVLVAEVGSRMHGIGGAAVFGQEVAKEFGWKLVSSNDHNYFVLFEFQVPASKTERKNKLKSSLLGACMMKKR